MLGVLVYPHMSSMVGFSLGFVFGMGCCCMCVSWMLVLFNIFNFEAFMMDYFGSVIVEIRILGLFVFWCFGSGVWFGVKRLGYCLFVGIVFGFVGLLVC